MFGTLNLGNLTLQAWLLRRLPLLNWRDAADAPVVLTWRDDTGAQRLMTWRN